MLHTTRAVVLRTFKHGDHTTVLKAYTEAFGARSYVVRNGKGPGRSRLLQPLNRLELVVAETHEKDLHAVRELRVVLPYTGVPVEQTRGLLLLFAQEVLYRTLREEAPDPHMFAFVQRTLEAIDTGSDIAHAPVILLVGLARLMGFAPDVPEEGHDRFDMREGHFFSGIPPHEHCMGPETSRVFAELLAAEEDRSHHIASSVRRVLLDDLLVFFRLHVAGFGELRSPVVLHALLH